MKPYQHRSVQSTQKPEDMYRLRPIEAFLFFFTVVYFGWQLLIR